MENKVAIADKKVYKGVQMFRLDNFKRLKETQGRTTEWLADEGGVNQKHVRAILRGERAPSLAVTKNWARVLEVPEQELWVNDANTSNAAETAERHVS